MRREKEAEEETEVEHLYFFFFKLIKKMFLNVKNCKRIIKNDVHHHQRPFQKCNIAEKNLNKESTKVTATSVGMTTLLKKISSIHLSIKSIEQR